MNSESAPRLRKPPWLKVRAPGGDIYGNVKRGLRRSHLHTVCEAARCPNQGECWGCGTATFMILGDTCTRGCRFCAVRSGDPGGVLDADEPDNVADAVLEWGLRHVVLTSVDRDDLPDGGAAHFARVIRVLRRRAPGASVECLVPDFGGDEGAIQTVLRAGPHVFAHNVETVERLSPGVRDRRASYALSLRVLRLARALAPQVLTKSSIMLGLGERDEEVRQALLDLRAAQVDAVTLGQYLQPTARHLPVRAYVHPDRFAAWEREAQAMGFRFVASGPLVRSSYRAGELVQTALEPRGRGGA